MIRAIAILGALSALAAGAPLRCAQAAATVVEHGVICAVSIEGRRPAPGTESGVMNVIDGDGGFDVITDTLPALRGLTFGIRVTWGGEAARPVRVVVTHPPMGAGRVTRQEWDATLLPGESSINNKRDGTLE